MTGNAPPLCGEHDRPRGNPVAGLYSQVMDKKSDYILPLGLLALAYFFGTKILQAVGIVGNPLTAANTARLGSGSAFNPNFWSDYKGRKLLLTEGAADVYADEIYNSVHWWKANEPGVFLAAMQAMKTKSQVSFLAYRFALKYGVSLLGYISQYLTPEQIAAGAAITDRLPNYLPA